VQYKAALFQRSQDIASLDDGIGEFQDAVLLRSFGLVPKDFEGMR
jgi:hypothetical protein